MTVTWTAINNGYRLGLRLSAYNGEENTDHHHMTNKGCSLEQWQIHECLQKARFLSVRVRICNKANGSNQLIHWLELADAAAHIHPHQFTHGTYGWIQLPWSNQKALGHFIPGQHEWRRHLHPTLVSWHWNPSCQRFHCVRFGNISLLVIPATGSIVQDEESTAQPGGAISYIGHPLLSLELDAHLNFSVTGNVLFWEL